MSGSEPNIYMLSYHIYYTRNKAQSQWDCYSTFQVEHLPLATLPFTIGIEKSPCESSRCYCCKNYFIFELVNIGKFRHSNLPPAIILHPQVIDFFLYPRY